VAYWLLMENPTDHVMDSLNTTRVALEHSADRWHLFLEIATAGVAIGVIVEIVALMWEIIGKRREKQTIERYELIAIGGAILVGLFVAAEVFIDQGATEVQTKLRSNNEATQDELDKRERKATQDAVELVQKFGGLHEYVETEERQLDSDMAAFKQFAVDERKADAAVIVEINRDRLQLEKARNDAVASAMQAQQALAKLETAARPRDLSPNQRTALVAHLSEFSGIKVDVWRFTTTTPDAVPFSGLLLSLLSAAHWNTVGVGVSFNGGNGRGVAVAMRPDAESKIRTAAHTLIDELQDDEIAVGLTDWETAISATHSGMTAGGGRTDPPADLMIIVADKP
jgi:hypothetical protein